MAGTIIFLAGLLFAITTARAAAIGVKGGIQNLNPVLIVIDFFGIVAAIALIVWGFINLSWYWPIVAFVVISLLVGVIVRRSTWPYFYRAMPVTSILTVAAAVYCWAEIAAH